jgi:uncharacterized protein YegL
VTFAGFPSYTANSLLNSGLAAFREEVYQNEQASLRVEVALVTFDPVQLAQEFVTIDNFIPPQLKPETELVAFEGMVTKSLRKAKLMNSN